MNDDLPPSLIRFRAELEKAIRRELGATTQPDPRSLARRHLTRRTIVTAAATAAIAVLAAVVLVLTTTSATTPAYALSYNPDGSVTVTLHDLAGAIPSLNARFARLGIDETVIPVTAPCRARTAFLLAPARAPGRSLRLTAGRRYLLPGWRGVLAARQLPDREVGLVFGALKGPLPSCFSSRSFAKPTRLLGHRHPATATSGHAASATPSARSITAQTLLLAKQNVAAFQRSHTDSRPSSADAPTGAASEQP